MIHRIVMHKFLCGLTLVLGMLIGSIIMEIAPGISETVLYLPFILSSFFFLILSTKGEYGPKIYGYIVIALIARFFILLWNVYGRDIYCFPGIGTDTEGFYNAALTISDNLSYLGSNIYGSYYSKYLGLLYYITGPSYLLGSYLNYLYSAIAISLLYKTLCRIEVLDEKALRFSIIVFAFLPNSMIIGSSLRRESMLVMFITASIYFIVKWIDNYITIEGIAALFFVLAASVLNAGIIGFVIGYILLLLFYNPKIARWSFRRNSIIMAIIIIFGAILVLTRYRTTFLAKLLFEDSDTIYRRASRSAGEAAYLTHITINSLRSLILYLPIKMLYFIASPLPQDWRGATDAIAFILDSIVYVCLVIKWIGSLLMARKNPLAFSLGISCISSLIIYAIGCSNSANAMRHRMKLLGIMIVVSCMVRATKNREKVK